MPKKRVRKKLPEGVIPRGEKFVARPYIPGHGHEWIGTFDDPDVAGEEAQRVMDELRRRAPSQETIRSFKNRWIVKPPKGSEEWGGDYPREKSSTNENYEREMERFAKEHGSTKLRDFKRIDARRLANKNPGMALRARAMFTDAMDEGLIGENVFYGLKTINKGGEQGRRNIVVVTDEEFDRLIQIAKDVHPHYDFWQIIVIGGEVGNRPSESWGFEHCDFNVPEEEVTVKRQRYKNRMQTPKSGEARTIVLPPRAAEAYGTLPRFSPILMKDETGQERLMDIVLRNKSGGPMGPTTLHSYWQKVRAVFEAELPPERLAEFRAARDPEHPEMDFYELRHRCATDMVERFRENGEDGYADVALQLGHSDEGSLVKKLYGHPSDVLARKRVKRLYKTTEVTELRPVEENDEAANG